MEFSGALLKTILLVVADLLEEQTNIPIITKKISGHCRELSSSIDTNDIFRIQPVSGGPCLFQAKDWEIVRIQTEGGEHDS